MFPSEKTLLVGDNPFLGISHLSQQRVQNRSKSITDANYAAELVETSVSNGANGFMFSVSDTTLSILRSLKRNRNDPLNLYALIPYAYEYVRLATHAGGISGLAKRFGKQVVFSGNVSTIALGLKGIIASDLIEIMKAYVSFEISRVTSAAKKKGILRSVLLHEVITDMAIALNLENLVKSFITYLNKRKIEPGFETRNFPYFICKFKEWNIDLDKITVATPFNKMGFYMNPSKSECERTLEQISATKVIAMSVFAAGYLKPNEAIDYISKLPNLSGVVVGVSNEQQASQTFRMLKNEINTSNHKIT